MSDFTFEYFLERDWWNSWKWSVRVKTPQGSLWIASYWRKANAQAVCDRLNTFESEREERLEGMRAYQKAMKEAHIVIDCTNK